MHGKGILPYFCRLKWEERAEREKRKSFHFSWARGKILQHANRGKGQQQRGHGNRGEDSSIYCWSVQYGFQGSGHDFRGRFMGTIFEKKLGTDFEVRSVHTVAWKSRQKTEKIRVWFLLLGTQIKTEIYLPSWDKLVWYFLCIAVNDKLLLKNKNTLWLVFS